MIFGRRGQCLEAHYTFTHSSHGSHFEWREWPGLKFIAWIILWMSKQYEAEHLKHDCQKVFFIIELQEKCVKDILRKQAMR